MKKILFILFTVQLVLIPQIIESYAVNSIRNNHEYSATNQGKKTINKDILGNTIVEDGRGYKKTIKTDIFGNKIIENNRGKKQVVKKDIFGNIIIEGY
ncbi:hypothetical protein [Bacteroides fragilis]|uniref:hypothetical protein n=1 Tax=Bacteroides fragilis TaxID=817 RepID=UPI001C6FFF15|nr:hypothetical protein [Bacteroides fragilis]MBW9278109.1 hypothetical protein [Bacteroides fragilis]